MLTFFLGAQNGVFWVGPKSYVEKVSVLCDSVRMSTTIVRLCQRLLCFRCALRFSHVGELIVTSLGLQFSHIMLGRAPSPFASLP